jgi:hypothetical protein
MKVKESTLKSLMLYNYRYKFAYAFVFIFALYFLAWKLGSITPGLSIPELQTAARNANLDTLIQEPIYPVHSFLQWISINLFGANSVAIRLPSVLLGSATVLLLYSLLKKWFGRVTSLVSIALLLSADWFLFIARLGTGAIEFSFWFVILILSLMKLIEKKISWLLVYSVAASFLLFAPFGIYAVITTTVSLFVCKMFRKRALEAKTSIKTLSVLSVLTSISLIGWISYNNVDFLKSITGFIEIPTAYNYFKNLVINSSGVVMIWPDNNPLLGPSGIFLIRFFEFIFMLFGLVMLWVTRVNRLNVAIIANAVVLALVGGLSSGSRGGTLLLIPAAVFMTAGLRHFIHRWERTFPKNPYAKVALLAPLVIIVLTTTMLHFQSYFVLWPKQTATHMVFQKDLQLLQQELAAEGKCIVVGASTSISTLASADKPACNTEFYNQKDTFVAASGTRIIIAGDKQHKSVASKSEGAKTLNTSTREDNVRWIVTTIK